MQYFNEKLSITVRVFDAHVIKSPPDLTFGKNLTRPLRYYILANNTTRH